MSVLDQWMSALSGFLAQRIPGFDPTAGTLTLPLWAGWAIGALLLGCLLLIFFQARKDSSAGTLARLALVLLGAGAAWVFAPAGRDAGPDGRSIAARAAELATRAAAPGSALACLDENAGETVETSCEKALFATPESTAAAVSYVAAQLALMTDLNAYARRGAASLDPLAINLRRAVERDRFGIVAHLLALREGCTPDQCRAFALLRDSSRVKTNLTERTYDFYVVRHAGGWPAIANPAMAAAASAQPVGPAVLAAPGAMPPMAAPTVAARTPASGLFFPSASSIPPVNIMNAEPGSAPQGAAAGEPTAKPARKPAPNQQAKKPPARRTPPPPAESDDAESQD